MPRLTNLQVSTALFFYLFYLQAVAVGIQSQTDLLKQDLVLVAVTLANQFDIIKSTYKQKLFKTQVTTINIREPNNIIDSII